MPTFVRENWRKVNGTLRERCVDSGSMRIGERSITDMSKVFDSMIDAIVYIALAIITFLDSQEPLGH